jgi:UDP-N-acetylmuramoyl-tripeptide--D-alanyl-D-alanine ligase
VSLIPFDFITRALKDSGLSSVIGRCDGADSVIIDSRIVEKGSLFVPLKGEKTDGHLYLPQALEKGASAVLVSAEWAGRNGSVMNGWSETAFFVVSDPLGALQTLAEAWRLSFKNLVVAGVTGSNGKTTTKEILAAILKEEAPTVWNKGNLNSEIGLPLSVFAIRDNHRFAVLEMGMNRVGEMDILARTGRPDVGVVTNIGTAHIGPMGSQLAIAEEKKKIFSFFTGRETAVIPAADPWTGFLSDGVRGRVLTYGAGVCEGLTSVEQDGLSGWKLTLFGQGVNFLFPGEHNLKNLAAAVTAARALGVSEGAVVRGVASVRPEFGRSEILAGRVTLIRDCYNANPDSVREALKMLAGLSGKGRRIAVLADMRELGAESEAAHRQTGRFVRELVEGNRVDRVFLFGEEMKHARDEAENAGTVEWFGEYGDLKERLLSLVREGDLLLLKGSRGMQLERLSDPLLSP